MGLSASAALVWGIPVTAFDDDGEPTPFWNAEAYDGEGDWREFESELRVEPFGHYEDPDNQRGVLTSARLAPLHGDCWDPQRVNAAELATETNADKTYSKANDAARAAGLNVNFYSDAGWWLVASYG